MQCEDDPCCLRECRLIFVGDRLLYEAIHRGFDGRRDRAADAECEIDGDAASNGDAVHQEHDANRPGRRGRGGEVRARHAGAEFRRVRWRLTAARCSPTDAGATSIASASDKSSAVSVLAGLIVKRLANRPCLRFERWFISPENIIYAVDVTARTIGPLGRLKLTAEPGAFGTRTRNPSCPSTALLLLIHEARRKSDITLLMGMDSVIFPFGRISRCFLRKSPVSAWREWKGYAEAVPLCHLGYRSSGRPARGDKVL